MKHEIQSAANFIAHLLRRNKEKKIICEPQLIRFRDSLIECFRRRYRDHWYPEKPEKGSCYRTIRCWNPKIEQIRTDIGSFVS
jgi:protein Tob/BTG